MASRGRVNRGQWQNSGKWNHPAREFWKRFPNVTLVTCSGRDHTPNKEEIKKMCKVYGEIVSCEININKSKQRHSNYQGYDQSRSGWRSRRNWNDRNQRGAETQTTFDIAYTTDKAAYECALGLNNLPYGGYRISAWSREGMTRCCRRPPSLDSMHKDYDSSCQKEKVSQQAVSRIESLEKCLTSNEAIKILEGCEIVTPDHFEEMNKSAVCEGTINNKENCALLKSEEYENTFLYTDTMDHDVIGNEEFIKLAYEEKYLVKGKKQRELKDVVIRIENCDDGNEGNLKEIEESTNNDILMLSLSSQANSSVWDKVNPIESENLEYNTSLDFLQLNEDSEGNNGIIGKEDYMLNEKELKRKAKKEKDKAKKEVRKEKEKARKEKEKARKEKADSKKTSVKNRKGFFYQDTWRCVDPSCEFKNSSDDDICLKCKLPCPGTMKHHIKKKDETENYNKYYLAYAKSCVEIYVQDYTQHRDAIKMNDILNKRFENGNIQPDKIPINGVFAVLTGKGWVRGKVICLCNGIKCSLLHIEKNDLENIQKQEESHEIKNDIILVDMLLNSGFISHETNTNIDNIHKEYQQEIVKIPYTENISSFLEHQMIIEIENTNETVIQKYFDSLSSVNANIKMVQSLKYLSNKVFKEIENYEKYECLSEDCNLPQEQENSITSDRKISDDLETYFESGQDNRINSKSNILPIGQLHTDVEATKSEEIINESLKFCHVSLMDTGEQCCIPTDNVGLLLRELASISEMKTGPFYLDDCLKIDDQTDEMKEEGRKWLKSFIENKPFKIIWKGSNEKYVQILIVDIESNKEVFINKEVCNRGYAKSQKELARICKECGRFGHMTRECPDLIKVRQCHKCGEFGHMIQNCPIVIESSQNQIVEKNANGGNFYGDYFKSTQKLEKNHKISFKDSSEMQRLEDINSTSKNMKWKILQRSPSKSCMTISSSNNPLCQECGNTGHQTELCPTKTSKCEHCNSRKHWGAHSCFVNKNKKGNYSMFTNEYNTINIYGNKQMEMTDMMVTYDTINMPHPQHRYRSWNESMPTIDFNLSPYRPIRSNSSLHSSIIATSQNQYLLSSLLHENEMLTTYQDEKDHRLSQKEGMVRALQEELTRIRTVGFVGLLDVIEKMKRLMNINSSLAKWIEPNAPMERAIEFLKENMRQFRTSDRQENLHRDVPKINEIFKKQDTSSLDFCGEVKLTPQEQLVALKVLQEAVEGIRYKYSLSKERRILKSNSTYEDAIDHYDKWKGNYKDCYIRVKAYYTNICDEWIKFSDAAKNIIDGVTEPIIPVGADMKKFNEQVGKLERLAKESEEFFQILPEILVSRINEILLQLEKFISVINNKKFKKQELADKETHLDPLPINESCTEITLGQYVKKTNTPLPPTQIDRIVKDILDEVKFEHGRGNSFGFIHPQNVLVTDKGIIKICPISNKSVLNKIENWDFTAPEALQRKSCKASDIYSIGKIILWLILYNESVNFNKLYDLLLEVMTLIREMIQEDPVKRPSIHEVLSHELFALPLQRKTDTSIDNAERKNFLSIIQEFVDKLQERISEEKI